ncbi:hypothetical protein [Marivita sp.]|uniref:hypothetical protein n=1 Tax=Marivita sp. TaxID=2003365 RepID=UPI003F6D0385
MKTTTLSDSKHSEPPSSRHSFVERIGGTSPIWDNACDVIVASMSIAEARQEYVGFTRPYYSNMLSFPGKKDSGAEISAAGLSGLKVGTLNSTVSSSYLQQTYDDVVDIRLYDPRPSAPLERAVPPR